MEKSLIAESNDYQEARQGKRVLQMAERYRRKYKTQMRYLEESSLLKKIRSITPYDYYALGSQLESFDLYRNISEEEGSLAQLGRIPKIGACN